MVSGNRRYTMEMPIVTPRSTAQYDAATFGLQHYQDLFNKPVFVRSVVQGAVFLAASMIAIFAAVNYATVHASNHVTDIVLSNVGPLNVRFLFIYGTFVEFTILIALLLWRPNRLPFALKSMALFLLIRAVFVSLTHIAPSPIDPQHPAPFLNSIFYGSDLFFSGHTGLPFLAALAFWHVPALRLFYLASTLFFGAIVLLGHYHYSIDVLAALFITHGIFQLACWLFRRDFMLFRSSEQSLERKPRKAPRRPFNRWAAGAKSAPALVLAEDTGASSETLIVHAADELAAPRRGALRERSA
jgi:PAP2 superfamily C-terminal